MAANRQEPQTSDPQTQAQHEPNPYQTYLPGMPKNYVEGLFPKPEISERIFAPAGTPAYNWRDVESITTDKPQPNIKWKPMDPAALYVNCMAWTAYPYGIPVDDQPCPYYKAPKRPTQAISSSSDTSSSSSSSSTSEVQSMSESISSENILKPEPVKKRPEQPAIAVTTAYGWTGK